MKQQLLTFLLILAMINAMSQDLARTFHPKYELGMSLGLNCWKTKDMNTSPLVYQSTQKDIGLHFRYYQNRSLVTFVLKGSIGRLFPRSMSARNVYFKELNEDGSINTIEVPANGNLVTFRLKLGYLYLISDPSQSNRFSVGMILSEEIFNSNGFTRPALMNLISLNPSFLYELDFNQKDQIHFQTAVPVLSVISRMPYDNTVSVPGKSAVAGFFQKGSYLASFDRYFGIDINLGYSRSFADKWKAGIDYDYQWYRIPEPRMLKMSYSQWVASLMYQL